MFLKPYPHGPGVLQKQRYCVKTQLLKKEYGVTVVSIITLLCIKIPYEKIQKIFYTEVNAGW